MEIFLAKNGQQSGPYSIQDVNGFLSASQITGSEFAWYQGCQDWIAVSNIPGLAKSVAPPLPTPSSWTPVVEQSHPPATTFSKPGAVFEVLLMAIPVIATLLIWFWVGTMNLFQSPENSLGLISVITILGTAIVAAIEGGKVGMVSDRTKGTYSPTAWFFIIGFMWVVGYPVYLYKRKHFGLPNRLIIGLLLEIAFMGSLITMNYSIEQSKNEIRRNAEQAQEKLEKDAEKAREQLEQNAEQAREQLRHLYGQ